MATNPFKVKVDSSAVTWDDELRERLESFRRRHNRSFAQISRELQRFFGGKRDKEGASRNIGLGQSTIYSYSTCAWPSSQERLEKFEHRLRAWLDHVEHGGKTVDIDDSVAAAKQIAMGLAEANNSQKFVGIIGPSGMGKSLLCKHFANAKTYGSTVIVEAYYGITGRAFLQTVSEALGDADRGSTDDLLKRVAGMLAEQPVLLIIDEANYLGLESLNHLVTIWNRANLGIVLMGTEELQRTVTSSELQRIRSRMKVLITLGPLNEQEIRRRLEESFDPKEVTPKVVDLATRGSYGSYRDLDTLIETATDKMDKNSSKSLEYVFEKIYERRKDDSKKSRR